MLNIPDPVLAKYKAWWEGSNETALFWCSYPQPAKARPDLPGWLTGPAGWALARAFARVQATGDFSAIDSALDYIAAAKTGSAFAADGFAGLFFNLGAGFAAAVFSSFFHLYQDTVWFELDQPMDWSGILDFTLTGDNLPWQTALAMARKMADRFAGELVLSNLDLGGVMDILASLRRTSQLLFDVVDEPGRVKSATSLIQAVWQRLHQEIEEIILPANQGWTTSWMELLSPEPYYPTQCDFAALISPEMFAELGMPHLAREMGFFKKGIFHLDGPDQLVHVDQLLEIPNLHAIQWVPGPLLDHMDDISLELYKKIISKGKKVILSGFIPDAEHLDRLFKKFPPEMFFITCWAKDYQQAMRLADCL